MRRSATHKNTSGGFWLVFLALALLGAYLRLDQFSLQVLLDDEWHVIHQLLFNSPSQLATTFGHADFSIPLALLYWAELETTGLSEIGMRWPMMLAGIAFLCIAPLYLRRYFGAGVSLLFMLLIAISPRLILYSKTARPYALTLLISLLAVAFFQKFVDSDKPAFKWGLLYAVCAIGSCWLHLVSLPLVVAPFAVYGIPALIKGDKDRVVRLLKLGAGTLAGLLLLVLPPLLGQPDALALKMGEHTPEIQSFYGMLYVWMGTSSTALVLVGLALAAAGAGVVWRKLPVCISVLTGLVLTLALILLTRPSWVQYSITLSRYLLPALPLFLLAVSAGAVRAGDVLFQLAGQRGKYTAYMLFLAFMVFMIYQSPLRTMLAQPNSNSLHSAYQFDYREDYNLVAQYQRDIPLSPFWQTLSALPRDSIRIAATPFSFESHRWNAARWEQVSGQRVMPGFLSGFCDGHWWGEAPNDGRFKFRNVAYLSDTRDMRRRGFDLLVYQKPFRLPDEEAFHPAALAAGACEPRIREQFGNPVFEDERLLVFALSDNIRNLIHSVQ